MISGIAVLQKSNFSFMLVILVSNSNPYLIVSNDKLSATIEPDMKNVTTSTKKPFIIVEILLRYNSDLSYAISLTTKGAIAYFESNGFKISN